MLLSKKLDCDFESKQNSKNSTINSSFKIDDILNQKSSNNNNNNNNNSRNDKKSSCNINNNANQIKTNCTNSINNTKIEKNINHTPPTPLPPPMPAYLPTVNDDKTIFNLPLMFSEAILNNQFNNYYDYSNILCNFNENQIKEFANRYQNSFINNHQNFIDTQQLPIDKSISEFLFKNINQDSLNQQQKPSSTNVITKELSTKNSPNKNGKIEKTDTKQNRVEHNEKKSKQKKTSHRNEEISCCSNHGNQVHASPCGSSVLNQDNIPMCLRGEQHLNLANLFNTLIHHKKCRRTRTVFTDMQLVGLEKRFDNQKYLSTPDRIQLANSLGLSQLQVKTWYQNRRMKWKKQVLKEGYLDAPTKPKGRPKKNSIPSFSDIIKAANEATNNNTSSNSSLCKLETSSNDFEDIGSDTSCIDSDSEASSIEEECMKNEKESHFIKEDSSFN